MTAVEVSASWRSEFKYDALGRRRVRTEKQWRNGAWAVASETRYVYDHMLVIQERDALNLPTATYTRGLDLSGGLQRAGGIGGLLALTQPSPITPRHFYYHADAVGNVTALIDTRQVVVAHYSYDPFGNLPGMAGPMADANLYRFSSKELHITSGLYYYGYRFYDSGFQRMITSDPLEERGGYNLYRFAMNRPIVSFDPFGLLTVAFGIQGSFGAGIGCNASAQATLSINGINPCDWRFGGQSTGCPFTSVVFGGVGAAGFSLSVSPYAECPEDWEGKSGFIGAAAGILHVVGIDISNIGLDPLGQGPWKFDLFLGEGVKTSPFGLVEEHFGVSWTKAGSLSPRELWNAISMEAENAFLEFWLWWYEK